MNQDSDTSDKLNIEIPASSILKSLRTNLINELDLSDDKNYFLALALEAWMGKVEVEQALKEFLQ